MLKFNLVCLYHSVKTNPMHAMYNLISEIILDAGLLARSQYPEGPATGHLDAGFSWFPCVYKRMMRWFPRFQVATTCFSCSPPDLNFLYPYFIFMYMHNNHYHRVTTICNLLLLLLTSTCFESWKSIVRKSIVIIQALWCNVCPCMWHTMSHQFVDTLDLQSKLCIYIYIYTLF